MEYNLLKLCYDLNNDAYKHSPYRFRIVSDKKRRDIAISAVRDRVVHRLLYDYLMPIIDPKLDFDVWSCRKDKGLHKALMRTQQLSIKYSGSWVWRADITKFFDSVNQEKLKQCLSRLLNDNKAKKLLDTVIESYTSQLEEQNRTEQNRTEQNRTGLPIGNLTSQILANIYLNELDRFVRHTIKPSGYVRYGDDFVLFFGSSQRAILARNETEQWLSKNLKLKLHIRNNVIVKASQGLHFLGHNIYPNSAASVDKTMQRKIKRNLNIRNTASYKAMHLTKKQRKQLDWWLLNDIRL